MSDFLKLKKRKEFIRVAQKGEKVVTTSLVLQAALFLSSEITPPRFGFTTTKKLGHAVVRNRARRRMRAVVRELFFNDTYNNVDYVLIGRHSTASCQYSDLQRDLKYAFRKINKLLHLDKNKKNDIQTTSHNN